MRKLFRALPIIVLLFVGLPSAYAGLSETCYDSIKCPTAGQDYYAWDCRTHIESLTGTTPSCQSEKGTPDPGKQWAFKCEDGCYQSTIPVANPCPGGIIIAGQCLALLNVVKDHVPVTGETAYKIWDGSNLTEVVHVNTAGCANGEAPISDSTSPTGWKCGSAGVWSTDGTNVWRATGNVGIGTSTPTVNLDVRGSTGLVVSNASGIPGVKLISDASITSGFTSSYEINGLYGISKYFDSSYGDSSIPIANTTTDKSKCTNAGGVVVTVSTGSGFACDSFMALSAGFIGFGSDENDQALMIHNRAIMGEGMGNNTSPIEFWNNGGVAFGNKDGVMKAKITSDGMMGIGTTSPGVALDVEVSSGGAATIGSSGNTAIGSYAVAMGSNTDADGSYATALGYDTWAKTNFSVAMGNYTTSAGSASLSTGRGTSAQGDYSITGGYYTSALPYASVSFGRYNKYESSANKKSWVASDPLFVIGNGTSSSDESNAFEVKKNGNTSVSGSIIAGGNIVTSGSVSAGLGTNTSSYLGRATVGYCSPYDSNYACFKNISSPDYAVLQNTSGASYFNAASGQSMYFRIGNSNKITLDSNGDLATTGVIEAQKGIISQMALIGDGVISASNVYAVTDVHAANNVLVDDLLRIYKDSSSTTDYWDIENNSGNDLIFTSSGSNVVDAWIDDAGNANKKLAFNGFKFGNDGYAYAGSGYTTPSADYAEWFQAEEKTVEGDLIGVNPENGLVRKYRSGDIFIGVHSKSPSVIGNHDENRKDDGQYSLVGLLGQLEYNENQVVVEQGLVKALDGKVIGPRLTGNRVLLGVQ